MWIPVASGIPDSLSCFPDCKAKGGDTTSKIFFADSGFHKQKLTGMRNPDSLT